MTGVPEGPLKERELSESELKAPPGKIRLVRIDIVGVTRGQPTRYYLLEDRDEKEKIAVHEEIVGLNETEGDAYACYQAFDDEGEQIVRSEGT